MIKAEEEMTSQKKQGMQGLVLPVEWLVFLEVSNIIYGTAA
jgi:hypothetical protein